MNFSSFKNSVAKQFKKMSEGVLYSTNVSKDELWECYLNSFPEGTNPIFRERSEHDCNACKQFIRNVGNVVSIVDNKLMSIWDIEENTVEEGYRVVSKTLSNLVKSKQISNIFLSEEKTAGINKTFEEIDNSVKVWEHLFVNIPERFVRKNNGSILSQKKASFDVFLRSLTEISKDSVETVLELINQNSIYRGSDYVFILKEFKYYQIKFQKAQNKEVFVWDNINIEESVLRIRNTAIGTLLVNLSEDKDLEQSVAAFERMVAPTNYKRPTALITKTMVDNAKKKIEELGLTSALERRYALLNDITINNVLFADRESKKIISNKLDEIFEGIDTKSNSIKNFKKVEEITIEDFINKVLPTTKSIELFVESRHEKNLMSLITSCDPTSTNLFKWNNNFSWSYNGELTDSLIKERVKKAGGSIEGDLCCRLAWFNCDDLDFHMREPSGEEIMFSHKRSMNGGELDVDMNAGSGQTREPVENIFYRSKSKMEEGIYTLFVHQFCKRETKDVGFEVEIDIEGVLHKFSYDKALSDKSNVEVAKIKYSKTNGIEIISSLDGTTVKKKFWNIESGDFHKVNVMMFSPNYWDDQIGIGNKHYFFILDNCRNEDTSRGFYNEFLKPELNEHRKVFEVLGNKIKVKESDNQLSGIGISSTMKEELTLKVTGNTTRILKIKF